MDIFDFMTTLMDVNDTYKEIKKKRDLLMHEYKQIMDSAHILAQAPVVGDRRKKQNLKTDTVKNVFR